MASKKVRVLFYYFSFDKDVSSSKNTSSADMLNVEESVNCFNNIYHQMKDISNGHKVAKLSNDDCTLEIISFKNEDSEKSVFGKIGRRTPKSTVSIRDDVTLDTDPINMTQTQSLELFTFFYLDFNTQILSFIYLQSAPTVTNLRKILSHYTQGDKIHPNTALILSEDVLKKICKRKSVSKLEIKVAVPCDKLLNRIVGMDFNDFDAVANVNTSLVTYSITAKRNGNLFTDEGKFKSLVNKIHNQNDVRAFHVHAPNDEGKSEKMDLLSSKYTKSAELPDGDLNNLNESDYYDALHNVYINNKQEIISLIN